MTLDEFKQTISECVKQELSQAKSDIKAEEENELMTSEKVAELFKVSKVTLHQWKKEGRIPFLKMNSRVYFKKNEIMQALEGGRVKKYTHQRHF